MSTAKQLPLSMPPREALGPADFARSPANDEAVAMLSDPARWPVGRLALVAPAGAGKSHLVNMLLMTSGAALRVEGASIADADIDALAAADPVIVEGAEAVAGDPAREAALFHLYNHLAARGGRLLLTARMPPASWSLRLPDLASRLATLGVVRIGPPDETLIASVMLKAAEDRGLDLAPEAVDYLLPRIERDFGSVHALVGALDAQALGKRRRHVSQRLAAACLRETNSSGDTATGRPDATPRSDAVPEPDATGSAPPPSTAGRE